MNNWHSILFLSSCIYLWIKELLGRRANHILQHPAPIDPNTLDIKYWWLRSPVDWYLHLSIKMHNLEKWRHNMNINNELFFLKEGTRISFISLWSLKIYIFIYLWIQQKSRCTGNTSHSKSRWKDYLKCSPNRYQGLKKCGGWGGLRRGRQQEYKENYPKKGNKG